MFSISGVSEGEEGGARVHGSIERVYLIDTSEMPDNRAAVYVCKCMCVCVCVCQCVCLCVRVCESPGLQSSPGVRVFESPGLDCVYVRVQDSTDMPDSRAAVYVCGRMCVCVCVCV